MPVLYADNVCAVCSISLICGHVLHTLFCVSHATFFTHHFHFLVFLNYRYIAVVFESMKCVYLSLSYLTLCKSKIKIHVHCRTNYKCCSVEQLVVCIYVYIIIIIWVLNIWILLTFMLTDFITCQFSSTSVILSSNKIENGGILALANPGPLGKWPLKRRERVLGSSPAVTNMSRWWQQKNIQPQMLPNLS